MNKHDDLCVFSVHLPKKKKKKKETKNLETRLAVLKWEWTVYCTVLNNKAPIKGTCNARIRTKYGCKTMYGTDQMRRIRQDVQILLACVKALVKM